jgi:hypothetical protein
MTTTKSKARINMSGVESDEEIIARLVSALRTGRPSRTPDGFEAISADGFNLLNRRPRLWRKAMRRIAEVRRPHPWAQARFMYTWHAHGWRIRASVKHDDTFFASLRVLLPQYKGPPVTLYRGMIPGQGIHPSWTNKYKVARQFALYGIRYGHLKRKPRNVSPRAGAHILKATLHREIITGELTLAARTLYGEFVVDPRGIDYEVEQLTPPKRHSGFLFDNHDYLGAFSNAEMEARTEAFANGMMAAVQAKLDAEAEAAEAAERAYWRAEGYPDKDEDEEADEIMRRWRQEIYG